MDDRQAGRVLWAKGGGRKQPFKGSSSSSYYLSMMKVGMAALR